MRTLLFTLCFVAMLASGSPAQRKFEDGDLKGFTVSPNEHIMNEIEKPFTVRSIEGVISDPNGSPLAGVLIEIRGPRDEQKFYSATTDDNGRYHVKHVKQGTYMFKTTYRSFQSEYGKIVVSKKADPKVRIDLRLPVGV